MSSKAKAKKEAIRQQTQLLNSKRELLTVADNTEDLMSLVPVFRKINRNGLEADFISFNAIPEEHQDWAFKLVETNMKAIYEAIDHWDPAEKEGELYHESSRFVFAFIGPKPVGFVHFNFDLDQGELSLFLLDVQVEDEFRHKAIGRCLVQACEFIALKLHMDQIKLSLLKENVQGRRFFRAMNYQVHKTSPIVMDPQNELEYDYEVLYKSLMVKKPTQAA